MTKISSKNISLRSSLSDEGVILWNLLFSSLVDLAVNKYLTGNIQDQLLVGITQSKINLKQNWKRSRQDWTAHYFEKTREVKVLINELILCKLWYTITWVMQLCSFIINSIWAKEMIEFKVKTKVWNLASKINRVQYWDKLKDQLFEKSIIKKII